MFMYAVQGKVFHGKEDDSELTDTQQVGQDKHSRAVAWRSLVCWVAWSIQAMFQVIILSNSTIIR